MIKEYKFSLQYKRDGKICVADGKDNDVYRIEEKKSDGKFSLILLPKQPIEMLNAYVDFNFDYEADDKVYVNGYQSWTTSREYRKDDVQIGLQGLGKYPPVKYFCSLFGDYDFQKYPLKKGKFHSYSYTYVKRGEMLYLCGSMTERYGFTVFHHDMSKNEIRIQKDVEGVTVYGEYRIFDLYWTKGGYDEVFDAYFDNLGIAKPKYKRMTGYTSWYNYYGNITEEILSRDIDGLASLGDKADIFQIDDGYQTAVGDWKTVKKDKYPHGMKYLVDKVHGKGYKAGLWLAPFNAQKSSVVAKEHPEWFIKKPNGKPEIGSIAWGGAYTMDFYIPEVAEYIKDFFKCVFEDWGFDMVKLDFLYSICHTPRRNKSRGQIMTEAMEFLRECLGDKIFLGCGVPLFPAFGVVDFCRISCDMGKTFYDPWYMKHTNQELFSTRCAMNNTIFRRHLDGRAFGNDPDVFYCRENDVKSKDKLAVKTSWLDFTDEQRKLLATVNSMLGNVLFVSDNVGGYDAEQRKMVTEAFKPTDRKVTDANYIAKDVVAIDYIENGEKFRLTYNTVTGNNTTEKI
ncbi:MAG: glycoside hydrolase family 36 protein [Christensenellales bacterium]